jgi:hypothetical protein
LSGRLLFWPWRQAAATARLALQMLRPLPPAVCMAVNAAVVATAYSAARVSLGRL